MLLGYTCSHPYFHNIPCILFIYGSLRLLSFRLKHCYKRSTPQQAKRISLNDDIFQVHSPDPIIDSFDETIPPLPPPMPPLNDPKPVKSCNSPPSAQENKPLPSQLLPQVGLSLIIILPIILFCNSWKFPLLISPTYHIILLLHTGVLSTLLYSKVPYY